MYWGRLQKKAKTGFLVGNWVMYLILMYFPFHAGGGYLSISDSMTSLSFEVAIFLVLFSYTLTASSMAWKIRCLLTTEVKIMGIHLFSPSRSPISSLILSMVLWSLSIKSHLLTMIITPLLFLMAIEIRLTSWDSKPLVASTIITMTSDSSSVLNKRITE